MSLVVWLPLNGSLENQGLSNITMTGTATYDANGKIGKCLNTSSGVVSSVSEDIKSIINGHKYTMALWVKSKTAKTTSASWSVRFGTGKAGECRGFYTSTNYTNTSGFHFAYQGSGKQIAANGYIDQKWHHFVTVVDNTIAKIYLDGTLIATDSVTATPTVTTNCYLWLTSTDFYLNDVRIYDHCLSAKEVGELAKGLVLHYRLAGPGQPNLTKGNNTYERNSASTDGWFWFSGSNFNCKPSTTYTLSIDIDGTISNFHGGSASTDPTKRWASMWFYLCKTGTSTNAAGGDYDSPINLNSTNYNFRKIGPTRYAWTYTTPADARSLSIRGNTYSNGTNAIKVKFWNPKIEEGSIATPWCPRADEPIYAALGYNNNIEYDCSGYCHNGIPVSTTVRPTWDVDSPRYTTSFNYSGDASQANYTTSKDMNFIDNFSWAIWIKPNYTSGRVQFVFTGGRADAGGFGYGLEVASTTSCTIFYGDNGRYSINAKSGEWHHVAFTKSGTTCKCYIDGRLVSTNTFSGTNPTYSDGNGVGIGCFHYYGDIYPYIGKASDLRIYATALSDADIAELYHSAVIVDNTGKTYAYEYFEA